MILGRYRRRVRTSHARVAVGRSTNAVLPTRYRPRARVLWGASPLFRVEDEGDGRNDVRVAHARPIVAQTPHSWPSGQMLPRRRDRAGTRTWRSMGGGRSSALPAARSRPCLPLSPIQGKFGLQSGPHYPLPTPSVCLVCRDSCGSCGLVPAQWPGNSMTLKLLLARALAQFYLYRLLCVRRRHARRTRDDERGTSRQTAGRIREEPRVLH